MDEIFCPNCQKPIMSIKKVENLLRSTTTKTLLSRCFCGVTYEIRSLKQNVLEISTSSGKRVKKFIGKGNQ
jgi:RNase P subunit RPR2